MGRGKVGGVCGGGSGMSHTQPLQCKRMRCVKMPRTQKMPSTGGDESVAFYHSEYVFGFRRLRAIPCSLVIVAIVGRRLLFFLPLRAAHKAPEGCQRGIRYGRCCCRRAPLFNIPGREFCLNRCCCAGGSVAAQCCARGKCRSHNGTTEEYRSARRINI